MQRILEKWDLSIWIKMPVRTYLTRMDFTLMSCRFGCCCKTLIGPTVKITKIIMIYFFLLFFPTFPQKIVFRTTVIFKKLKLNNKKTKNLWFHLIFSKIYDKFRTFYNIFNMHYKGSNEVLIFWNCKRIIKKQY